MTETYVIGLKAIAQYFNLSISELMYLIQKGGIPGIMKLKRKGDGTFPGGGRGVWVISEWTAQKYREIQKTSRRYDPGVVVEALLEEHGGERYHSIPELINAGLIDDYDWCDALTTERERCNMHIPILMHKADLHEYFKGRFVSKAKKEELYPETVEIFKTIRKQRGANVRTRK